MNHLIFLLYIFLTFVSVALTKAFASDRILPTSKSGHDLDSPACETVLQDRAGETFQMKLSLTEQQRNREFYSRQLGIKGGLGKSFLDVIGVHPENFSNIVILSLNNYLGDSLIFHFSLIPFLRSQYPNSELTLISPKADVVFPSLHYNFKKYIFPVRFAEYQNRKDRDEHIALLRHRLPHFIKAHIKPGSLVLFDLTTLIKASSEIDSLARNPEATPLPAVYRALTEIGAVGIGVSNLENGYIMSGLAQLDVVGVPTPQGVLSSPWLTQIKEAHGQSMGFSFKRKIEPHIFESNNENIYQSWLANMSFIFGDQLELSWSEKIYNSLDERRTREYLASQSSFPD
ncbi:MAG TPA: hypothetical protein PLU50_07325, partial [Pseudobdellovibrionaceae bacterium]|nr:hypothetical protein [Pseudobdellovibrionaceae bacterium]